MEVFIVSLLNGLVYGMLLFMLASGLTLILSMMGVLNFAHASAYMLGAYFAYTISVYIGFWPALIIAPLLCGLIGAAIEMWGLRRVHRNGHIAELLFTFGLALIIEKVVQMSWGLLPVPYRVPELLDFPLFKIYGTQFPAYRAFMLLISALMFVAIWLGLTRTRVGLVIQAALTHPDMASALGHNVPRIFIIEEPIIGHREEGMAVTSPEDAKTLARLDAALAEARSRLDAVAPQLNAAQDQWAADVVRYAITLPELAADSRARRREGGRPRRGQCPEETGRLSRREGKRVDPGLLPVEGHDVVPGRTRGRRPGRARAQDVRRRAAEVPGERPAARRRARVRILPRGNWMDETGEVVKPALPHYLPQPDVDGPRPDAARPGPLARLARQPAHRPRGREPALEAVLRRGAAQAARRPRRAGRAARRTRRCSTGWPASSWTAAGT